jgi:hypothetical protein
MKIRVGSWAGIGLVLLGVAAVPWLPVWGQAYPGPLVNLTAGGLVPLPPPPPQGAWGEVIMANERWLVVQNTQGQQFPVAAEMIQQFLVRWPTTIRALTNQSWVEATGTDAGSMTVRTAHIDVYEGSDRTLVQPTYRSVIDFNRVVTTIDPSFQRMMNAFDIAGQNTLYGWAYPIEPGDNGIPGQMYAVGNALQINPQVQIGVPGNNVVTILPDTAGNLTISQVTRGSTTMAEKGDYVFLTPTEPTPKSLRLTQLVLYKKVTLREFSPP